LAACRFIFDFVNGVDRFTERALGARLKDRVHYRELPLVIDGQSRTARFKTSVSEASNSSWTAREELWAFSDPAGTGHHENQHLASKHGAHC